jgi:hypothetical protein
MKRENSVCCLQETFKLLFQGLVRKCSHSQICPVWNKLDNKHERSYFCAYLCCHATMDTCKQTIFLEPKQINLLLISFATPHGLAMNSWSHWLGCWLSHHQPTSPNAVKPICSWRPPQDVNLWLIINCCHLIITNSKMPCYINSGFSCTKDNTMHNFYNLPFKIICYNVFWDVFWDVFSSSNYAKKQFITSKSMKGLPHQ